MQSLQRHFGSSGRLFSSMPLSGGIAWFDLWPSGWSSFLSRLAFLLPIRGGGCLYLLLFGWAMIFAKASCDLIALISRTFMLPGQRVAVDRKIEPLSEIHDAGAAPILETLRVTAKKTPGWTIRIVLISVLAVSFALFTDWENRRLSDGAKSARRRSKSKSRHRCIRFPEVAASAPQHSASQTGRAPIPKQMASSVHSFFGLE